MTKREIEKFLFSFEGRITRAQFWLYLCTLLSVLVAAVFSKKWLGEKISNTLVLSVVLCQMWTTFAVYVKRLHDTGQSGWWSLLVLVTP
jgi:uncharacterized membrane protein YhaH (DUF805 family)